MKKTETNVIDLICNVFETATEENFEREIVRLAEEGFIETDTDGGELKLDGTAKIEFSTLEKAKAFMRLVHSSFNYSLDEYRDRETSDRELGIDGWLGLPYMSRDTCRTGNVVRLEFDNGLYSEPLVTNKEFDAEQRSFLEEILADDYFSKREDDVRSAVSSMVRRVDSEARVLSCNVSVHSIYGSHC